MIRRLWHDTLFKRLLLLMGGALLLGHWVARRPLGDAASLLVIAVAAWWGARWLAHALRLQVDAQLEDRGLLVAAISHDLRTPLARLRMRLESLGHDADAQRGIADLREMNTLIDSALQLFRGDEHAEPVQRTDVLALVLALADDLVEQGHEVQAGGMPVIAWVQPQGLRRALANLLGNAVHHGEHAEVQVLREPEGIRIVVEDAGPGIPPAQLETVFEPFRRIDCPPSHDAGGTGLGLYIARDLVQRQGGRLTLANRPEGGLRATLLLPTHH